MKKVIKLTESDLMRIVKRVLKEQSDNSAAVETTKRKTLPVKPEGAAYEYADFTDKSLNSRVPITNVSNMYQKGFFGSLLGQGRDGIDWKNFNSKQFCDRISGQGYNTLLQPKMVQTYAEGAVHPPVKYVCDSGMNFLVLVPINSLDAEQIYKRGGGIDYQQNNTKHLIKDKL